MNYFSDVSFSIELLMPTCFLNEVFFIDDQSLDGMALAFVRNEKNCKLLLLSSGAVKKFFEARETNPARRHNTFIWITDLAGRSIREDYPGSDLYDDELFQTFPVQKAYFHALLINLSFDHIFANPRMRQEFAK